MILNKKMAFKTLCEHVIQEGDRKNEMCGCFVYEDERKYCDEHNSIYHEDYCFEHICKSFQNLFQRNTLETKLEEMYKLVQFKVIHN